MGALLVSGCLVAASSDDDESDRMDCEPSTDISCDTDRLFRGEDSSDEDDDVDEEEDDADDNDDESSLDDESEDADDENFLSMGASFSGVRWGCSFRAVFASIGSLGDLDGIFRSGMEEPDEDDDEYCASI